MVPHEDDAIGIHAILEAAVFQMHHKVLPRLAHGERIDDDAPLGQQPVAGQRQAVLSRSVWMDLPRGQDVIHEGVALTNRGDLKQQKIILLDRVDISIRDGF